MSFPCLWLGDSTAAPGHRSCTSCVSLLLKYGANPHSKNLRGFLPLHAAALSGSLPIAKAFLKVGVDVDSTSRMTGCTPLHICMQAGTQSGLFLFRAGRQVSHSAGSQPRGGQETSLDCCSQSRTHRPLPQCNLQKHRVIRLSRLIFLCTRDFIQEKGKTFCLLPEGQEQLLLLQRKCLQ